MGVANKTVESSSSPPFFSPYMNRFIQGVELKVNWNQLNNELSHRVLESGLLNSRFACVFGGY